jgi:hypothetical protein
MKRALCCAAFASAAALQSSWAQGGPPMITDDPGTPGNEKWEINLAVAFEHRSGETSLDLPEIDLNYGVGANIQLTLQTAPVLLMRGDHGPVGGMGGTETAVKWRFLDEDKSGFDVSMFPRIIFNIQSSSVRRGLAEDGTRFQIPFQLAKTFGRFHADAEFGPVGITSGRSEWLYGIVGGYDLAKTTGLLAEFHGTSRINFTREVLTLNFGIRQRLNQRSFFIGSLGHEVYVAGDEPLAVIGYFGVQLLY